MCFDVPIEGQCRQKYHKNSPNDILFITSGSEGLDTDLVLLSIPTWVPRN